MGKKCIKWILDLNLEYTWEKKINKNNNKELKNINNK